MDCTCQAPLFTTMSQSLLKFMSIELIMPSNCCLPLLVMPSIFPSIRVFSNEVALRRRLGERLKKEGMCVPGGQSSGASASASVLPMTVQGWFPLGLTGLISLLFKGLSRVFSNTTVQKRRFFGTPPPLCSHSHIYT